VKHLKARQLLKKKGQCDGLGDEEKINLIAAEVLFLAEDKNHR
jgi:hypothetical protein